MTRANVVVRFSYCRLLHVLAILVVAGCGSKELSFFGPDGGSGLGGDYLGIGGGVAGMGFAGGVGGGFGGDPNAGSPCDRTTSQALSILQTHCAYCHTDNPNTQMGNPKYNVLDIATLVTPEMVWTTTDPVTMRPFRFLVPGQPDRSAIYVRIVNGSMPKQPYDVRVPSNPVPTVSDLSVLRAWISSCLGDCADRDLWGCNDAPAISLPSGTCRAGVCSCNAGFELNPVTRRCRVPIPDPAGGSAGAGGGSACGAVVNAEGGPPPSLWPTDDACAGEQLPIVGTWVGYVENMTFPSGSDALRMTVRAANATRLCGSVTLGSGMPPPPVTDPNVGYPTDLFACDINDVRPAAARSIHRFRSTRGATSPSTCASTERAPTEASTSEPRVYTTCIWIARRSKVADLLPRL